MYSPEYLQCKLYMERRLREADHSRLVREALGTTPRRVSAFSFLRVHLARLLAEWRSKRVEHVYYTADPARTGKAA